MRVRSTDGVELELHDLGGDGPTVLVAHATGFCGGAYRPFAARLVAHGHHVWAVDFRAHGDSTRPDGGDMTWRGMADDVLAVAEALGGAPLLAYGHSMGGAALAAAELRRPGTLGRAVWFEPIIIPPEWRSWTRDGNPLAASARRRRPTFGSREEALARYAGRPPLGLLRADALAAYVEHGFADEPDGSIVLKCAPEDEAATFEADGKAEIAEMPGVASPVLVTFGAREMEGPAAYSRAIADALPHGEAKAYAHLGHFGPFQDPDTLADDTAEWFRLGTEGSEPSRTTA